VHARKLSQLTMTGNTGKQEQNQTKKHNETKPFCDRRDKTEGQVKDTCYKILFRYIHSGIVTEEFSVCFSFPKFWVNIFYWLSVKNNHIYPLVYATLS